jgi:hypothetical protein
MEIQITNKTSAYELISEVYRKLPSRNYRQNWQDITLGMEQNLSQVKDCAEKIGVRLIEIEAE